MAKNIVLCSDGTGNTANKGRGTNVFKLYEAVDVTGHKESAVQIPLPQQLAFYDDGVGTERFKPLQVLGSAFGIGLSRNVRQLYTELCRCYEPGDKIYVFGFSRGAFTVRTLAGLIVDCGIVKRDAWKTDAELAKIVKKAWRAHRRYYHAWLQRVLSRFGENAESTCKSFRDEYAIQHETHPNGAAPIQFIGVWDTVAAVGLPFDQLTHFINTVFYRFTFPDYKLSPLVKKACHAVAIDDERHTFHPLMWDECPPEDLTLEERASMREDRIEQVWFPGVHSNVGGGYPKQGMSLVSLDWMITKAEDAGQGLRFHQHLREGYRALHNVHDKLYDSRAGLAVYYRYKPRDIQALSKCSDWKLRPCVHVSTFDRLAQGTDGYAPGAFPSNLKIVATPSNPARQGEDQESLGSLASKIRTATRAHQVDLEKAKPWILIRRYAHYALFAVTIVILWLAARFDPEAAALEGRQAEIAERADQALGIFSQIGSFISDYIVKQILVNPGFAAIVVALVIFYAIGLLARTRIQAVYSRFWREMFRTKDKKPNESYEPDYRVSADEDADEDIPYTESGREVRG